MAVLHPREPANTEQLHARVDSLVQRVRQLENALEVLQTLHYAEVHPLLTDELRGIATPLEEGESSLSVEELPTTILKEEGLSESMGTLALDKKGIRFFGPTAVSFAGILWKEDHDTETDLLAGRDVQEVLTELTKLPNELSQLAYIFPFRQGSPSLITGMDPSQLGLWIRDNCLPPYPEAWALFETYWEHYAWHFTPFTRTEFIENIFSPLYRRTELVNRPLGHALGLCFMVFAIGELVDFTKPLKPNTGTRYYLLARASLCLDAVIESPTLTALQAMHLMLVFGAMARGTVEIEHLWMLSGINVKLALTLGLQHHPAKFKFPQEEIRNRQHTLIAVLSAEMWQARK
ncbi:hypothetical protein Clacol_005501 [Clathrus columnatus]|uniref:Xylanolytic transcriptional activator regulatory domain-containing protein n=1 Tax=Clathrus columnatus TaxID=1419009 RepID=A0AAV5ADL5_9AGAM|nr:hypothetical protein Clacol_005501 [Clathrus columnatus]